MARKPPPRPPKSAAKAAWVDYIVKAHGAVRSDARQMTKSDLIFLCDQAERTPQTPDEPPPEYGFVETATRRELADLHLDRSALAASAIAMARRVDEEQDVAAARELRMTLARAESLLANSRPGRDDDDEGDDDGKVVGPNRLEELRKAAASGSKGRRR